MGNGSLKIGGIWSFHSGVIANQYDEIWGIKQVPAIEDCQLGSWAGS